MKRIICSFAIICLLCSVLISVSATETSNDAEVLIHHINCDTANGWMAPVSAADPYVDFLAAGGVVDTDDKMEGNGCLSLVANPNAFAGPAVNLSIFLLNSR